MTDLCDRADAQSQCISYIKKAVDVDPEGIETTLCNATYKKTIGDIEGARQECSRCVEFLNILKASVSDGITDGCEIDLPSVEKHWLKKMTRIYEFGTFLVALTSLRLIWTPHKTPYKLPMRFLCLAPGDRNGLLKLKTWRSKLKRESKKLSRFRCSN